MKGNTLTPSHLGYSSIWWVQEGTRNSCTFWNIPMTPCLTSWSSNRAAIFALSRPVSMSGVSLATSSLPWTDVESNASDFIFFQTWTVLFVWELCFPKCSPPPYGSFPWLVPHQASRFSAYAFLLSFSKCKVDHGDAQSLLSLVYWSQPPCHTKAWVLRPFCCTAPASLRLGSLQNFGCCQAMLSPWLPLYPRIPNKLGLVRSCSSTRCRSSRCLKIWVFRAKYLKTFEKTRIRRIL